MSDRQPNVLPDGDVVKVERDIWDKERFIAWLEKMPAGGTYNSLCINGHCLLDQYAGRRGAWEEVPDWFCQVAYNEMGKNDGRPATDNGGKTFGAALARARNLLP